MISLAEFQLAITHEGDCSRCLDLKNKLAKL